MNTTYLAIGMIILVVVVAAILYYVQRPSAPVVEEKISAPSEQESLNVEQEIGADVLPSETELNIDVNDVTMELPGEI